MPLVSGDWQDPARWAPARVAWGVLRDGDALRLARLGRSGGPRVWTVTVADWLAGAEPAAQLARECARGARLAAGLDPSRVLLRLLESPIDDPAKSRETFPALLDSRIPFPLERCVAAFLPQNRLPEGGHACTAVAIREADLEAALAEWQAMGLDPDLLLPEALLLGETPGTHVWNGASRAVFLHRGPQGADAAGAARNPAPRVPALHRFLRAQTRPGPLRLAGPNTEAIQTDIASSFPDLAMDSHPDLDLAVLLARAGQTAHAAHANLRAGVLASPRLRKRRAASRRQALALFALAGLLAALAPFGVRAWYAHDRAAQQLVASRAYAQVTGRDSPAPGQETLLLERHLQENWAPLRGQALRLAAPGTTDQLAEMLETCRLSGVNVRKLVLNGADFELHVPASEAVAAELARRLREGGWEPGEPVAADGIWRIRGRVGP
jgi:hypothetical protein